MQYGLPKAMENKAEVFSEDAKNGTYDERFLREFGNYVEQETRLCIAREKYEVSQKSCRVLCPLAAVVFVMFLGLCFLEQYRLRQTIDLRTEFFYPFNETSGQLQGVKNVFTSDRPGKVVPLAENCHGNMSAWPLPFDRAQEGWMEVSDGFEVKCRFPTSMDIDHKCLLMCYSAIQLDLPLISFGRSNLTDDMTLCQSKSTKNILTDIDHP